ncbi:MAG: SCO family protein [Anaerolineae bacterium]|nr:SCO family protein [Anaerolineae bacterium]
MKQPLVLTVLLAAALAAAACSPAGRGGASMAASPTSIPPTSAAAVPSATALPPTPEPPAAISSPVATSAVDNSQTTAVAGRLAEIAATRAAGNVVPTTPPTRAPDATQNVAAIATAFGIEAAAASQGVSLGTVINPPLLVRDFTLPASTGADLSLHELDGKFRMIFFGYLHCPDFCPLTMAEFKRVKQLLGEYANDVDFIYISVDGARDTPELLARYLNNFDPNFIGFSGDDVTLAGIQPDYGFYYQRRLGTGSQAEYVVDHSTRSYLLDRAGRLRSSFTYDTSPEAIADALRWYIQNE